MSIFIGREEDITHLLYTIQQPDCRLLTLIGMGGIGKTRLAGQIFRRMENLPDGAVWVSLEAVHNSDDIVASIARHPHFELDVNTPQGLLPYLENKQMLIILDQYEHLLPHTDWLLPFITHCPQVKWLITSQSALNLSIEWIFPVKSLTISHTNSEAMLLFAHTMPNGLGKKPSCRQRPRPSCKFVGI